MLITGLGVTGTVDLQSGVGYLHGDHESTSAGEPADLLLDVLMAMSCKIHGVSLLTSWHGNELKYSTWF